MLYTLEKLLKEQKDIKLRKSFERKKDFIREKYKNKSDKEKERIEYLISDNLIEKYNNINYLYYINKYNNIIIDAYLAGESLFNILYKIIYFNAAHKYNIIFFLEKYRNSSLGDFVFTFKSDLNNSIFDLLIMRTKMENFENLIKNISYILKNLPLNLIDEQDNLEKISYYILRCLTTSYQNSMENMIEEDRDKIISAFSSMINAFDGESQKIIFELLTFRYDIYKVFDNYLEKKDINFIIADVIKDLDEGKDYSVMIDRPDFKMIKLKTPKAGCIFGKDTQWCTATSTRSGQPTESGTRFFKSYSSYRSMILFIIDNQRYQLSILKREYMFMNIYDIPVSPKIFLEKFNFDELMDFINFVSLNIFLYLFSESLDRDTKIKLISTDIFDTKSIITNFPYLNDIKINANDDNEVEKLLGSNLQLTAMNIYKFLLFIDFGNFFEKSDSSANKFFEKIKTVGSYYQSVYRRASGIRGYEEVPTLF